MKFTASTRQWRRLSLAAGFCLLSAAAMAQSPAAAGAADEADDAAAAPEKNDEDILKGVDIDKLDWSQLDVDASKLHLPSAKGRTASKPADGSDTSWSSNAKGNGAAAVSVKQSISPFWDTRIGADMTVVNPAPGTTSGDLLQQKISPNAAPESSSGSAWAAISAPGVGSIWDKTSVEARVDPATEQGKLGTRISKSVPLGDSYFLTLQNGYNVIQQGLVPVPGVPAHPSRNTETEQSAKLSIGDTGTSFTAGRTLSSSDDKWLGRIGAEQKLFDGVTVSGSIGETPAGATSKSISAGFKRSW
ncbi:hypothetical protein [Bradyrhizobium sp.]|uniref:hypothetical protein n=1 Tax=Bradyrhizobium sp. TaxID=376 RepID=UPI001D4B302E|nr:hypothetical protein [Bradyrhizobium sp.]MBI5323206.1 hypothetical protein [Bradyrhizobium sp.]